MESSKSVFDLLRQGADTSVTSIRDSDVALAAGNVAHAMDHAGRPLLLVPLESGAEPVRDTGSRGVTLQTREVLDAGTDRLFLVLRCEIPSLHEPFSVLCDEVLSGLVADPTEPVATCVTLLDRWRDLLGPGNARLLGESALLGLLAELWFLELLLRRDSTHLHSWTGPTGTTVDFTAPSAQAEVKATADPDGFTVGIHGLSQLELPQEGNLYLWAVRAERVSVGGDSVPDAVRRLRSLGVDMHELLKRLDAVGYAGADEQAYSTVRFTRLDDRALHITGAFPRITASTLADPGFADHISHVRYSVDLNRLDTEAPDCVLDGVDEIAREFAPGTEGGKTTP